MGENSYNLVTNNCEHFVSWCIYGVSTCQQIRNVLRAAGIPGTTIVPSIAAVISAASQSDELVQTAAKVAAKEAMSSAAIIGAATIVGGPIGLAGAAAILAAKKVLLK
ncbi:NC domain protein [compost metagenome]